MSATGANEFAHRIVETAVELAEQGGWEAVRLHQVAAAMGIGLDDIRRHFREKDELIDAFFDRADDAVLALSRSGDMARLSPRQRLFELIMAWLDTLESHRQVCRQMICAKLEPGHLHIQIPALMRVSRTVQWMREGAQLTDSGVRRALLEVAATSLYLAAFAAWMSEDTPGSPRTRRLLDGLLERAEGFIQACPVLADKHGMTRNDTGEAGMPPAWTP